MSISQKLVRCYFSQEEVADPEQIVSDSVLFIKFLDKFTDSFLSMNQAFIGQPQTQEENEKNFALIRKWISNYRLDYQEIFVNLDLLCDFVVEQFVLVADSDNEELKGVSALQAWLCNIESQFQQPEPIEYAYVQSTMMNVFYFMFPLAKDRNDIDYFKQEMMKLSIPQLFDFNTENDSKTILYQLSFLYKFSQDNGRPCLALRQLAADLQFEFNQKTNEKDVSSKFVSFNNLMLQKQNEVKDLAQNEKIGISDRIQAIIQSNPSLEDIQYLVDIVEAQAGLKILGGTKIVEARELVKQLCVLFEDSQDGINKVLEYCSYLYSLKLLSEVNEQCYQFSNQLELKFHQEKEKLDMDIENNIGNINILQKMNELIINNCNQMSVHQLKLKLKAMGEQMGINIELGQTISLETDDVNIKQEQEALIFKLQTMYSVFVITQTNQSMRKVLEEYLNLDYELTLEALSQSSQRQRIANQFVLNYPTYQTLLNLVNNDQLSQNFADLKDNSEVIANEQNDSETGGMIQYKRLAIQVYDLLIVRLQSAMKLFDDVLEVKELKAQDYQQVIVKAFDGEAMASLADVLNQQKMVIVNDHNISNLKAGAIKRYIQRDYNQEFVTEGIRKLKRVQEAILSQNEQPRKDHLCLQNLEVLDQMVQQFGKSQLGIHENIQPKQAEALDAVNNISELFVAQQKVFDFLSQEIQICEGELGNQLTFKQTLTNYQKTAEILADLTPTNLPPTDPKVSDIYRRFQLLSQNLFNNVFFMTVNAKMSSAMISYYVRLINDYDLLYRRCLEVNEKYESILGILSQFQLVKEANSVAVQRVQSALQGFDVAQQVVLQIKQGGKKDPLAVVKDVFEGKLSDQEILNIGRHQYSFSQEKLNLKDFSLFISNEVFLRKMDAHAVLVASQTFKYFQQQVQMLMITKQPFNYINNYIIELDQLYESYSAIQSHCSQFEKDLNKQYNVQESVIQQLSKLTTYGALDYHDIIEISQRFLEEQKSFLVNIDVDNVKQDSQFAHRVSQVYQVYFRSLEVAFEIYFLTLITNMSQKVQPDKETIIMDRSDYLKIFTKAQEQYNEALKNNADINIGYLLDKIEPVFADSKTDVQIIIQQLKDLYSQFEKLFDSRSKLLHSDIQEQLVRKAIKNEEPLLKECFQFICNQGPKPQKVNSLLFGQKFNELIGIYDILNNSDKKLLSTSDDIMNLTIDIVLQLIEQVDLYVQSFQNLISQPYLTVADERALIKYSFDSENIIYVITQIKQFHSDNSQKYYDKEKFIEKIVPFVEKSQINIQNIDNFKIQCNGVKQVNQELRQLSLYQAYVLTDVNEELKISFELQANNIWRNEDNQKKLLFSLQNSDDQVSILQYFVGVLPDIAVDVSSLLQNTQKYQDFCFLSQLDENQLIAGSVQFISHLLRNTNNFNIYIEMVKQFVSNQKGLVQNQNESFYSNQINEIIRKIDSNANKICQHLFPDCACQLIKNYQSLVDFNQKYDQTINLLVELQDKLFKNPSMINSLINQFDQNIQSIIQYQEQRQQNIFSTFELPIPLTFFQCFSLYFKNQESVNQNIKLQMGQFHSEIGKLVKQIDQINLIASRRDMSELVIGNLFQQFKTKSLNQTETVGTLLNQLNLQEDKQAQIQSVLLKEFKSCVELVKIFSYLPLVNTPAVLGQIEQQFDKNIEDHILETKCLYEVVVEDLIEYKQKLLQELELAEFQQVDDFLRDKRMDQSIPESFYLQFLEKLNLKKSQTYFINKASRVCGTIRRVQAKGIIDNLQQFRDEEQQLGLLIDYIIKAMHLFRGCVHGNMINDTFDGSVQLVNRLKDSYSALTDLENIVNSVEFSQSLSEHVSCIKDISKYQETKLKGMDTEIISVENYLVAINKANENIQQSFEIIREVQQDSLDLIVKLDRADRWKLLQAILIQNMKVQCQGVTEINDVFQYLINITESYIPIPFITNDVLFSFEQINHTNQQFVQLFDSSLMEFQLINEIDDSSRFVDRFSELYKDRFEKVDDYDLQMLQNAAMKKLEQFNEQKQQQQQLYEQLVESHDMYISTLKVLLVEFKNFGSSLKNEKQLFNQSSFQESISQYNLIIQQDIHKVDVKQQQLDLQVFFKQLSLNMQCQGIFQDYTINNVKLLQQNCNGQILKIIQVATSNKEKIKTFSEKMRFLKENKQQLDLTVANSTNQEEKQILEIFQTIQQEIRELDNLYIKQVQECIQENIPIEPHFEIHVEKFTELADKLVDILQYFICKNNLNWIKQINQVAITLSQTHYKFNQFKFWYQGYVIRDTIISVKEQFKQYLLNIITQIQSLTEINLNQSAQFVDNEDHKYANLEIERTKILLYKQFIYNSYLQLINSIDETKIDNSLQLNQFTAFQNSLKDQVQLEIIPYNKLLNIFNVVNNATYNKDLDAAYSLEEDSLYKEIEQSNLTTKNMIQILQELNMNVISPQIHIKQQNYYYGKLKLYLQQLRQRLLDGSNKEFEISTWYIVSCQQYEFEQQFTSFIEFLQSTYFFPIIQTKEFSDVVDLFAFITEVISVQQDQYDNFTEFFAKPATLKQVKEQQINVSDGQFGTISNFQELYIKLGEKRELLFEVMKSVLPTFALFQTAGLHNQEILYSEYIVQEKDSLQQYLQQMQLLQDEMDTMSTDLLEMFLVKHFNPLHNLCFMKLLLEPIISTTIRCIDCPIMNDVEGISRLFTAFNMAYKQGNQKVLQTILIQMVNYLCKMNLATFVEDSQIDLLGNKPQYINKYSNFMSFADITFKLDLKFTDLKNLIQDINHMHFLIIETGRKQEVQQQQLLKVNKLDVQVTPNYVTLFNRLTSFIKQLLQQFVVFKQIAVQSKKSEAFHLLRQLKINQQIHHFVLIYRLIAKIIGAMESNALFSELPDNFGYFSFEDLPDQLNFALTNQDFRPFNNVLNIQQQYIPQIAEFMLTFVPEFNAMVSELSEYATCKEDNQKRYIKIFKDQELYANAISNNIIISFISCSFFAFNQRDEIIAEIEELLFRGDQQVDNLLQTRLLRCFQLEQLNLGWFQDKVNNYIACLFYKWLDSYQYRMQYDQDTNVDYGFEFVSLDNYTTRLLRDRALMSTHLFVDTISKDVQRFDLEGALFLKLSKYGLELAGTSNFEQFVEMAVMFQVQRDETILNDYTDEFKGFMASIQQVCEDKFKNYQQQTAAKTLKLQSNAFALVPEMENAIQLETFLEFISKNDLFEAFNQGFRTTFELQHYLEPLSHLARELQQHEAARQLIALIAQENSIRQQFGSPRLLELLTRIIKNVAHAEGDPGDATRVLEIAGEIPGFTYDEDRVIQQFMATGDLLSVCCSAVLLDLPEGLNDPNSYVDFLKVIVGEERAQLLGKFALFK